VGRRSMIIAALTLLRPGAAAIYRDERRAGHRRTLCDRNIQGTRLKLRVDFDAPTDAIMLNPARASAPCEHSGR